MKVSWLAPPILTLPAAPPEHVAEALEVEGFVVCDGFLTGPEVDQG